MHMIVFKIMLNGFLSRRRGGSSGCGRRRRGLDTEDSCESTEQPIADSIHGPPASELSLSWG